ncbi:MAG: ATP-binding protein [Alphaproteobacteria bacterium]
MGLLLLSPARAYAEDTPPIGKWDWLLSTADHDWLKRHGAIKFGVAAAEWPPFDLFSPSGEFQGITAAYLGLLRERLGQTVTLVKLATFNDVLAALRDGRVDVMGSIASTPDRQEYAIFTLPYVQSPPVIITRKDDSTIRSTADLAGKKVAIERGFASQEFLQSSVSRLSFLEVGSTREALKAVALGNANAYVGSLISATYLIDKDYLTDLEVRAAAGYPTSALRFAVRADLPELARLLDLGLASITDEEHATIRKKWIVVHGLGIDWRELLRFAVPLGTALLVVIGVVLIWNRRLQREVVKRRDAEQTIKVQIAFQQALMDNIPNPISYKDAEAMFFGCNRAYEAAFGVTRESLLGTTVLDLESIPLADRQRYYEEDLAVIRERGSKHLESRTRFADGTMHDILLWKAFFSLPDGSPGGILNIIVDVTERKRAEQAIADQLALQEALVDAIPSPIYLKDHEARYVGCNRAFEEAFDTKRELIKGMTARDLSFLAPERREAFYQRDLELLRTNGHSFTESQFKFADGKLHDTLFWVHTFALPGGRPGGLVGVIVDVSEQKRLERQAQEAERRLRDMTNSVPGAVYQFRIAPDGSRAYSFISEGVKQLRGVERDEVLRNFEVLWDQVLDEDKPGFSRELKRVVAEGIPLRYQARVRLPDGTVKWLEAAADSHKDPDGAVILNGYWFDVTERRNMQAALEVAKEAADAANRAKSSFLATMSHEIRTPMNGVLGMLELLSLSKLSPEQHHSLESVRESGRSLLRIIDDILDFSKIEAGKLEVRPEAVSVAEIVESVMQVYIGVASSKNLLLEKSLDPGISPAVTADPLRLRQILNNFASNALKFTAEGRVEIKAELVERRDGIDVVRFSVKDTGIGVAPADQQKLFQPFVQAEGDTTRRFGGTGLGLTICRRLADMMNGTIEMESAAGKGTTMRLTLPLPIADPKDLPAKAKRRGPSAAALAARRPAPSLEDARADGTLVLLADDHPTNRALLLRQLNILGYAAEAAENGVEALEKWQSGRFALLITDCHMPEMDGYDLARAIRKLEAENGGRRAPIIACTANALADEGAVCIAAGMDGYLPKPVELEALLGALERWLPLPGDGPTAQAEKQRVRSELPLAAAAAALPIDRALLAELSGGDAAVERDILSDFRGANVADAAMLKAAIDSRDAAQLTRACHRVKGASRMVGALSLAEVCDKLERAGHANDWDAVAAQRAALLHELERLNDYLERL